jgi:hypothetical protein
METLALQTTLLDNFQKTSILVEIEKNTSYVYFIACVPDKCFNR